jgi:prepilin-type N-terminal cleavage/methylation domain-containing protein
MRARKRQRGFSLVEVLVAVTLFTLVSAGTTSFAVNSMRRTSANRASATAVIAGQQEIEDLRSLAYADIGSRWYNTTIGGVPYSVLSVVENNTPANGMKRVTVTVGWTSPLGNQTHVIRTILTQITT